MKKTILLFGILAVVIAACQQDSANSGAQQSGDIVASPTILAGQWIAMDFCARANQYGSVLGAMNNAHRPYAYAFEFTPNNPDSVICYNGFETWTLPVKYNKDTLEVMGASQGKSVFLLYQSQGNKEMTLFDGTQGSMIMERFVKSKAGTKDGYVAFAAALNHNLFNGAIIPLGKDAGRDTLLFTPGGFIMNWKAYDQYSFCTGGDCFVTEEPMDVITLSRSDTPGSEKMYGFRYNGTNDTLTFYNIVNTRPEEKFAYEIKAPAYKFYRIPQQ